jgi:hypothetical protein
MMFLLYCKLHFNKKERKKTGVTDAYKAQQPQFSMLLHR